MVAKIRIELYAVLLIAVILTVYWLFYHSGSSTTAGGPRIKLKSKQLLRNAVQGKTMTRIPLQRASTTKSSAARTITLAVQPVVNKTREVVPRPTKARQRASLVIKEFKLTWKKRGSVFYREIVPDGRPKHDVLLLHGQTFTSAIWVNLTTMNILANAGYRVIAMDLPGYGKSKSFQLKDTRSPPKSLVKFLATFLQKSRVVSPVIVSPSASGKYSLPYIISGKNISGFVPIAVVATDRYALKNYKSFKAPTLILRGSRDNSLGTTSMKTLHDAIPHSQTKVIEGAGHACYVDKPKEFHQILLNFLNSIVKKNNSGIKN